MDQLPRIPSPAGTAFREFRIAVLPALVFTVVLGMAVVTWRNYVGPSQLVGEVEAIRSEVIAPQDGQILELHAGLLQRVHAGEPVAVLLPTDPKALAAKLQLSQSRLDLLRDGLDVRLRQQNNTISSLQLRLNWMDQRAELASLRAQHSYSRLELDRQEQLMKFFRGRAQRAEAAGSLGDPSAPGTTPSTGTPPFDRVAEYQVAQRDFESLNAQLEERSRLVDEIEQAMARMRPEDEQLDVAIPEAVRTALDLEEQELKLLETQVKPVTLVAAVDGMVSRIHRNSGENVTAGDTLLTVSGQHPERVVAYLRQPLNLDLRTNMTVEIRSRALHHETGLGRVVSVGTQLEPILPQLLPRNAGAGAIEYGLPVLVSLPPGLRVYGGEVVDLFPADN